MARRIEHRIARIKSSLLTFLVILFAALSISAQEEIIRTITIDRNDGLPTRWTKSVVEDHDQLIWIGTIKGVSRYDGYQIRSLDPHNSKLRHQVSDLLMVDIQGYIWTTRLGSIGSIGIPPTIDEYDPHSPVSIDIINPTTLEITSFDEFISNKTLRENEVRTIEKVNDIIWIKTLDGQYYKYDGNLHRVNIPSQLVDYEYVKPSSDFTFIGYKGNVILEYNASTQKTRKWNIESNQRVRALKITKNETWISAGDPTILQHHELYIINDQNRLTKLSDCHEKNSNSTNQIAVHKYSDINDLNVLLRPDGSRWILSNDNFQSYDNQLNCSTSSVVLKSLDTDRLTFIGEDSSGRILSCPQNGINITSIDKNYFITDLYSESGSNETRAIHIFNDSLILATTYTGLYQIKADSPRTSRLVNPIRGAHLSSIPITENTALLGHPYGISILDKNGKAIKDYTPDKPFEHSAIFKDNESTIHIGTEKGMFTWDSISLMPIPNEFLNTRLKDFFITDIHEYENGLWIATLGGLFLVNSENKFTHFSSSDNTLPFDKIYHINRRNNFLWLSTNGGGLIKFNLTNFSYRQFKFEDGLSNNYVHASYFDSDDYLWISSDIGLMRFDTETNLIRIFSIEDGIPEPEFNRYSHAQAPNGTLYFGTVNGVISFDPSEINNSPAFDHKILFTKIDVLQENQDQFTSQLDNISRTNALSLSPKDRYVDLEFTNTNYTSNTANKYAYIIEGLNNNWSYTTTNKIQFSQLPYGQYKLRIKGQGNFNNELTLDINVPRPLYATSWFIALMSILFLLAIYWLVRYRLGALENRNTKLESEVRDRTKELEDVNRSKDKLFAVMLHDLREPISSFNNLGKKVKYLIQKSDWETLDAMVDQIESKSQNLNTITSTLIPWIKAQIRSGELKFGNIKAYHTMEEVHKEMEGKIQKKEINFENNLNPDSQIFADRGSLLIIFRNLLSNAIKYSHPGGTIECRQINQASSIKIEVIDEGIGMNPETVTQILGDYTSTPGTQGEEGLGLGLKLSKDLAISNQAKFHIFSRKGEGTCVTLEFSRK